jgi:hypothetical protein
MCSFVTFAAPQKTHFSIGEEALWRMAILNSPQKKSHVGAMRPFAEL